MREALENRSLKEVEEINKTEENIGNPRESRGSSMSQSFEDSGSTVADSVVRLIRIAGSRLWWSRLAYNNAYAEERGEGKKRRGKV